MSVFDGNLYAEIKNYSTGCEVWKYDGSSWKQVNTDGFGDINNKCAFSMVIFLENLYVGSKNWVTGCEVWQISPYTLNLNAIYEGTALHLDFTLATKEPVIWSLLLICQFKPYIFPIWSIPIPAIDSPIKFSIPIEGFHHLGTVGFFTFLAQRKGLLPMISMLWIRE